MRQVRATTLHLGDPRVGIVRMRPVIVGSLLRALAIQLRQLLTRGCLNAALSRQPREELVVSPSAIAPHDGSKRRVSFQRRRVYADRGPLQQFLFGQHLKHPLKHCLMRLDKIAEWSGTLSSSAMRTNDRIDKLSLARHAIPRSESIPSK